MPLCVLEWITLPYQALDQRSSSYKEELPTEVAQFFDAVAPRTAPHTHVQVTSGSYHNDRALAIPGPYFTGLMDLIEHVRKENVTIVDEFEGHIY